MSAPRNLKSVLFVSILFLVPSNPTASASVRKRATLEAKKTDVRTFQLNAGVPISFAESRFYFTTEGGEVLPVEIDQEASAGQKVTLLLPMSVRGSVKLVFHIVTPSGKSSDGELGLDIK